MGNVSLTPEHNRSYEYLKEFSDVNFGGLQFFGVLLVLLGIVLLGYSFSRGKDIRRMAMITLGTGVFFYYFDVVYQFLCTVA